MIKFLILILVALIVFPIVIFFMKKIDLKTKLMFLVGGFSIALLGLLVQSSFSLYYSLLIMLGLIFVESILVTKQIEKQKFVAEELHVYKSETIQKAVEKSTQFYVSPKPVASNQTEDWLKPSKKES